jgi:hypothetical protein
VGKLVLGAGAIFGGDEVAGHQHRTEAAGAATADVAGLDAVVGS